MARRGRRGWAKRTEAARWSPVVPLLSALLALAGGIHLAALGDHLGKSALHGGFFLVVAARTSGLPFGDHHLGSPVPPG